MIDINTIAYCGLFCGACRIYIYNQNNTLEKYSEETGIPMELLKCNGCRSEVNSIYCRNCVTKKCCLRKQIFSCADCKEFPCSALKAFDGDQHPHHKGVIDSLFRLKETGNEQWINEQTKYWSCKKCGAAYSWYQAVCSGCGSEVNGLKQ